ncbi:hypothetical protein NPIL_58321 [Nephila pilipes]|uniref:Uncharacterized protein n=1 Tax=Nephila pilipes TaxID=299642 RepID=A0A8X6NLR9_NEPPI|nr:hypothetical protein NPIL_58321 [Nephila pilipes]
MRKSLCILCKNHLLYVFLTLTTAICSEALTFLYASKKSEHESSIDFIVRGFVWTCYCWWEEWIDLEVIIGKYADRWQGSPNSSQPPPEEKFPSNR